MVRGVFRPILPTLSTTISQGEGINDRGDVVSLYTDAAGNHGFELTARGVLTTIDKPPAAGSTTAAFGINNSGTVVGFQQTQSGWPLGSHS